MNAIHFQTSVLIVQYNVNGALSLKTTAVVNIIEIEHIYIQNYVVTVIKVDPVLKEFIQFK